MARQASSQKGFGSRPVCQHCFAPVQRYGPWSKQRPDSCRLWREGMVGRVCSTQSQAVWHKWKVLWTNVSQLTRVGMTDRNGWLNFHRKGMWALWLETWLPYHLEIWDYNEVQFLSIKRNLFLGIFCIDIHI